ncbi:MAG: U32 family peptidase, partial [Treponema sp.]|nr:U32 family peptidase [Treponema sp.]
DKTTIGASDSKYELAAGVGKEVTGSDFDSLYELGQKNYKIFKDNLDSMHPAAREARLKDLEIHTDRQVNPFQKKDGWKMYQLTALNKIDPTMEIQFVSPEFVSLSAKPGEWELVNPETGTFMNWVCDGHPCVLYTKYQLPDSTLVRAEDPEYVSGIIRDTGR